MSKNQIILLVVCILFLLGGSVYGYEYFTNKSAIQKADALYQEGKFDEAITFYKQAGKGWFGTHNYDAWSGEYEIQNLQKSTIPMLERAKKALQSNNIDTLLVAYQNLRFINPKYEGERTTPAFLDKEIKENEKIAQNKIITLAKQAETNDPATSIKLYSIFTYNDNFYKEAQSKVKSLYKPAFLQKYNEKKYTEALSFYEKIEDKAEYKNELNEFVNHSRIEAAKQNKNFAMSSYMNGEMTHLEKVTNLLLQIDSTSTYAQEAKNELENLNQEIAYKMGVEEYKVGNLDESLHFLAQVSPKSPHYKDASQKLTEISQKLEKEYKDTALTQKRTAAYKEIEKQLSPYLNNKNMYSVILSDVEEANKKFKYTIVYQNGITPITQTTNFLQVSENTYNFFLDDIGMEILSNKGQQITQAGYSNYVGNTEYGQWRENNEGSFWEFYGKYALLSTLFNSNRIYRDDYNTYNRYYRTSNRPYYGSVYVPLSSAVRQTPRFEQTIANRSQKSWFYAKSVPSRSSSKSTSTASTSNKSWYYGKQPMKRSSYTSASTASNRSSYGHSSYSSSSGSYSSNKNKSSRSSSSSYKSSSSSSSSGYRSSRSSSSRTTRSSSSSSRSRSSSSRGGK